MNLLLDNLQKSFRKNASHPCLEIGEEIFSY